MGLMTSWCQPAASGLAAQKGHEFIRAPLHVGFAARRIKTIWFVGAAATGFVDDNIAVIIQREVNQ